MTYDTTPTDLGNDGRVRQAHVILKEMKPTEYGSIGEWAALDPQDQAEATRAAFDAAGVEYTGASSVANTSSEMARLIGGHFVERQALQA